MLPSTNPRPSLNLPQLQVEITYRLYYNRKKAPSGLARKSELTQRKEESVELTQASTVRGRANISRTMLAITIVAGMAYSGADEVLVSTPFIVLSETLGLWAGWAASTGLWAAAGIVTLVLVDAVWPRLKPTVFNLWASINPILVTVQKLLGFIASPNLPNSLIIATAAIIGTVTYHYGTAIIDFLTDHVVLVGFICGVALLVFILVAGYEWVKVQVERLVAYAPTIARRRIRTAAKLVAGLIVLVYMGPVLSRPFLVPLGVRTKRWAYVLTFVAAPCFSGFWYPIYTLGVWDTISRILGI